MRRARAVACFSRQNFSIQILLRCWDALMCRVCCLRARESSWDSSARVLSLSRSVSLWSARSGRPFLLMLAHLTRTRREMCPCDQLKRLVAQWHTFRALNKKSLGLQLRDFYFMGISKTIGSMHWLPDHLIICTYGWLGNNEELHLFPMHNLSSTTLYSIHQWNLKNIESPLSLSPGPFWH